jgi:hypothetical protein
MDIYEIDGLRLCSGQPKRRDQQKAIAMSNQKVRSKTEKELQETILQEKVRGTPDLEIGQKYGVTFMELHFGILKNLLRDHKGSISVFWEVLKK